MSVRLDVLITTVLRTDYHYNGASSRVILLNHVQGHHGHYASIQLFPALKQFLLIHLKYTDYFFKLYNGNDSMVGNRTEDALTLK